MFHLHSSHYIHKSDKYEISYELLMSGGLK